MNRVATSAAVQQAIAAARAAGRRIGFVPTLGYLHEGHLSLVERARASSDFVVLSAFVNPLQFAPSEDLASYPRDLERDAQLAATRGVDLFFAPEAEEMYPAGRPAVTLVAPQLSSRLCGAFRPGHFEGVLTVVAKLFHIVLPDIAVFGRKDLQQLVLIRRMVRDLDFPVDILEGPTVREADGLAMSSRNIHLDEAARADARLLNHALRSAQEAFERGEREAAGLVAAATAVLGRGPLVRPQYVEVVDAESLDSVQHARPGNVLAIAAYVGGTRLIDNDVLG